MTKARLSLYLYSLSGFYLFLIFNTAQNISSLARIDLLVAFVIFTLSYFYCIYKPKLELKLYLTISILLKLCFIFTPIILTTDFFRYAFEGYLTRSGVNPYLHTAEQYINLYGANPIWSNVDHAHLSAIYPPVAQLFLALFASSELLWKSFILLVDLGCIWLLYKLIKLEKLPYKNILIFAMSPLCLIEFSGSGHLDLIFIFFSLLCIYLYRLNRNNIVVAVVATLAILTKYIPILYFSLLAFFDFKTGNFKKPLRISGLTFLFSLLMLMPFLFNGLTNSLGTYVEHWRFNDSLFHLLGYIFSVDFNDSTTFSRIKTFLFISWIFFSVITAFYLKNFYQVVVLVVIGFLIQSSVFHPWYAIWFLPFLCLWRSPAAIFLSVAVLLSYQAGIMSENTVNISLKIAIFGGFLVIAILEPFGKSRTNSSDFE